MHPHCSRPAPLVHDHEVREQVGLVEQDRVGAQWRQVLVHELCEHSLVVASERGDARLVEEVGRGRL